MTQVELPIATKAIDMQGGDYLLCEHARVCVDGDSAIFLNLKTDEYVGLDRRQTLSLRKIIRGWPHGVSDGDSAVGVKEDDRSRLVERLVERGFLTHIESLGREPIAAALHPAQWPLVKKYSDERLRISFGHVLCFLVAWLWIIIFLRIDFLEKVVPTLGRRRERSPHEPTSVYIDRLRTATAIFKKIRPFFYTVKDHCLFDSLVLMQFLHFHRLYPRFVLGVRATPFQAHAWVQEERYVLNGPPDYIRRFTPLLIV